MADVPLVPPARDRVLTVPARMRTFAVPAQENEPMTSLVSLETRTKHPAEVETFVADWQAGYPGPALDAGETITASGFTAEDGIDIDAAVNDATTATVTLSGGTAGEAYKITNEITTSAGRTLVFSFKVWVL